MATNDLMSTAATTAIEQYPFIEIPPAAVLQEEDRGLPIVVTWDAPYIKSYEFAPFNPDALVATKGFDELDKLKGMSAYTSAMDVKKKSILYKGWDIKPAIQDQTHPDYEIAQDFATELKWHIENIVDEGDVIQNFIDVLYEMLDACHYGFHLHEIEWRYIEKGPKFVKGHWGFKRFSAKRCKQIGFRLNPINSAIRAITNRTYFPGDFQRNIPPEKCVLYTYRQFASLPHGFGDARVCYKHWWTLDFTEKLHSVALEIHGIPHYRVSVPGQQKALMDAVREAFDKVRSGASLVLPENVTAELDTMTSGTLENFIAAKEWQSTQIRMAILLQELTTSQGTGVGSYALGEVHQHTEQYGMGYVRRQIEWVVTNQIFRRWVRYNKGEEYLHLTPLMDLGEWDASEKSQLATVFKTLTDAKIVYPTEPMIREKLNLPAMDPASQKAMEEEKKQTYELSMQKALPH